MIGFLCVEECQGFDSEIYISRSRPRQWRRRQGEDGYGNEILLLLPLM
jgi:hypothetical protein